MLLAVGGSLVSAAPASATAYQSASINSGGTSIGGNNIAISVASCSFAFSSTTLTSQQLSDFTVLINGTSVTPVGGNYGGSFINLGLASNLPAGALVSVAYTLAHGSITCANGTDTVGTFGAITYQLPSAPALTWGSPSMSTGGSGTSFYFLSDQNISYVWTVRLASANPPSITSVFGVSWTSDDIVHSSSAGVASANNTATISNVSGLTASTQYTVYIVGSTLQGAISQPLTMTFSAPSSQVVQNNPAVVVTNPAQPTYANGAFTSTGAVWQNSGMSPRAYWLLCTSSHSASNGNNSLSNLRPSDCMPFHSSALTNQQAPSSWLNTNPITLPATTNRLVNCNSNCTTASFATTGAYLAWYEFDNGVWTMSETIATDGSGSTSVSSVSAPTLSPTQARNMLKPVPAAVQPLVPAFLALNKPMASLGGSVALSAGDFTGLVSAKIANKSIDFILGKTGQITMTVPQGEAGKTADLVLTFNTGSIILQDAIKYVAPVVVADVPVRPVAIKAGAKSISESAADEIRHAALANLKNDTIQCVAYSASNSAAAKAAAQLTAVQACGVAVKANPELKVADVEVIIDKLKARTQGVGIKVYKANN
jgi:hypothetical protein